MPESDDGTHVSVDDFRIVRDNTAGGNRKTDDQLILWELDVAESS